MSSATTSSNSKAYTVPTQNRFAFLDSDADSDSEGQRPTKQQQQKSDIGSASKTAKAVAFPSQNFSSSERRGGSNFDGGRPSRGGIRRPYGAEGMTNGDARDGGGDFEVEGRGGYRRGGRGGTRGGMFGEMTTGTRPVAEGAEYNNNNSGGYYDNNNNNAGYYAEGNVDTRGAEAVQRARAQRGRVLRGGRGGGLRGREFDRHSGTGRGREMKKSGGGAHNWGGMEADENPSKEASEMAGQSFADTDTQATGQGAEGEGVGATQQSGDNAGDEGADKDAFGATEEPVVEEPQIDYADYLRMLEAKRVNLPKAQPAKARTVDVTDLEKEGYQRYDRPVEGDELSGVNNKKKVDSSDEGDDEEDSEEERKPKTINFFEFAGNNVSLLPNANRRGRGGRGRGDRGRGGFDSRGSGEGDHYNRGPREDYRRPPPNLNLQDNSAFPSL